MCNVKGKVYRLLYEMNKNVRIRVKTPVGLTKSEDVGPCVTQGGIEAGTISSVSIGNSVSSTFSDSDCEVQYRNVNLRWCKPWVVCSM